MSWRFDNEAATPSPYDGALGQDRRSLRAQTTRDQRAGRTRGPSINRPSDDVVYKKRGKGCTYCTKYSIFLSNAFIFLLGVAILCVGLWAKVNLKKDKLTSFQDPMTLAVIITGSVIAGVALFGCFGAWIESKFLLIIFLIVLVILLLIQGAVGIVTHFEKDKIPNELDTLWTNANDNLRNYTQNEFVCCGFHNSTDREVSPCPAGSVDKTSGAYITCDDKLTSTIGMVFNVLEYTSIAIAVILLFALLTTVILMCILRSPSRGEYQAIPAEVI